MSNLKKLDNFVNKKSKIKVHNQFPQREPGGADIFVESSDNNEIEKAKVYIQSPDEAPKGAVIKTGARQGKYYESEEKTEIITSNKPENNVFDRAKEEDFIVPDDTYNIVEWDIDGGIKKYAGVDADTWDEWAENPEPFQSALNGKGDKELQNKANLIQAAASSYVLPVHTVFRGESYKTVDEVLSKYKYGKHINLDKITSAGMEKDVAEVYSTAAKEDFPVSVILNMASKNPMQGIQTCPSSTGTLSAEVVLPKGMHFRVARIIKESNKRILIDLYRTDETPKGLKKVGMAKKSYTYLTKAHQANPPYSGAEFDETSHRWKVNHPDTEKQRTAVQANLLGDIHDLFTANGYEIYEVGGRVRDSLLGRHSEDIDLTSDARPGEIKKIFEDSKLGKVFNIGEKFGTIGITTENGDKVEVTTYRNEKYQEGNRKPEVTYGKSLKDDLSRRDFTINSMAVDFGKLIKYYKNLDGDNFYK